MNRFLTLFQVPANNPELAGAQFRAFSRQLPLMYLILLFNTGFLAISLYSSAPYWLAVGVPCVLAHWLLPAPAVVGAFAFPSGQRQ